MRPLRFLLTLVSCCLAFILLLAIGPWTRSSRLETSSQENYNSYYWHTPSSLFPPSAIISITDDNSTNFLARPAAFGPLLPSRSLSGQLWIGSGFGEDHLGRGGSGAGAQGELGCSDVPGWEDGKRYGLKKSTGDGKGSTLDLTLGTGLKNRRSLMEDEDDEDEDDQEEPTEHDGTDDHLHHPLLETGRPAGTGKKAAHADIQSLQESAEIAGKVVLLSRGGCGFLEKVKWVQRRGGIALIVGDDIRGGPLVTMYARGDTSNVTIPSVFISHMTAQLLSSLMPSGALVGSQEDAGQITRSGAKTEKDKPNFTTSLAPAKATSTAAAKDVKGGRKNDAAQVANAERGWLSFFTGSVSRHQDSRRPPSSGSIEWQRQQEFADVETGQKIVNPDPAAGVTPHAPRKGSSDGFQIGVQDWRDPDLVAAQREQQSTSTSSVLAARTKSSAESSSTLRGGSITPGSGEYKKSKHTAVELEETESQPVDTPTDNHSRRTRSWFGRLFYSTPGQEDASTRPFNTKTTSRSSAEEFHPSSSSAHSQDTSTSKPPTHEGLWVTLSPASMSTSPFFDTLLVLVVSPLVTLTIVYALLLLRSRIRRRRWRAPKSVVERLPVRTYQTMPSTTTSSSASDISAPTSVPLMSTTSPTPTTPLLQHHASSQPITTTRPAHPRSQNDPQASSSLLSSTADTLLPAADDHLLEEEEEKAAAAHDSLAEWRRRSAGKQRECVVCLEEYVDGVSRVMRLPCGHEFHEGCITPWLTTRRRTCPICKGDVVRSLARSSQARTSRGSSQHAYSYFSGISFSPSNTEGEHHVGFGRGHDRGREEERALMLEVEEEDREENDRERERQDDGDLERGTGR